MINPITQINGTVQEFEARARSPKKLQTIDLAQSQLWFPAVSGHFFGTPNLETKWSFELSEKGEFLINAITGDLAKQATQFDVRETSLLIEPATTKFARITPFLLAQYDGEPVGQARWVNSDSGKERMLVFFSQACRALGSIFYAGKEVRFDLVVPAAGLFWLENKKRWLGPDRYVIATANNVTTLAVLKQP
ncbi:MAG: hypothetical protein AB8B86_20950 [Pseudomonadales bacterium]